VADIERARQLMVDAQKAMDAIETYTCVIHCHERIKGKVRKPESIFSRFRKPRSVYLRWQKGPYEGLQASHHPDRDGPSKFQARETGLKGLAGATTWDHSAPIIDSMYPHHFRTHETSVAHLLALSAEIQEKAVRLGKLSIADLSEVDDPLLGKRTSRLVCELSKDPADGLRWSRTEFYFDTDTKLPLHFKLYDLDGEMFGEYAFKQFEANAQLPPDAFDLKKL